MLPTMTNDGLICLALRATSKDALFDEMAELLVRDGAVSDRQQFISDLWAGSSWTAPASSRAW